MACITEMYLRKRRTCLHTQAVFAGLRAILGVGPSSVTVCLLCGASASCLPHLAASHHHHPPQRIRPPPQHSWVAPSSLDIPSFPLDCLSRNENAIPFINLPAVLSFNQTRNQVAGSPAVRRVQTNRYGVTVNIRDSHS